MKIFVITKRTLAAICAAVIFVVAALILVIVLSGKGAAGKDASNGKSTIAPATTPYDMRTNASLLSSSDAYETEVLAGLHKELPIYSVARNDKSIALTIDAAWEDDKTPFILETLAKYNVKATFFLCGFWVKAYPDQVKAIYEAGHTIGNHTMTHPHMNQLSSAQILDELKQFDDLLESVIGVRSTLFRAPYGEYNDTVIKTVRAAGYEIIQWNNDTVDWKAERSSQTILDTVLPKLSDGCIILCHNNGYTIEEYLPTLIETAMAQGFSFVSVNELLLEGETVIDVNGVQKPA